MIFILIVLLISGISASSNDVENDSFPELIGFDLNNEEIAQIASYFQIDPTTNRYTICLYVGVPEIEYKEIFSLNDSEIRKEQLNELANLFGFVDYNAFALYSERSSIVQTVDGVKYIYFRLCPENTKLASAYYGKQQYEGADFLYFASYLFGRNYFEKYRDERVKIFMESNEPLYNNDYYYTTFYNDVNYDGKFNSKDISALKRCIVSSMKLYNIDAADQNDDGHINTRDLKELKKKIAGG